MLPMHRTCIVVAVYVEQIKGQNPSLLTDVAMSMPAMSQEHKGAVNSIKVKASNGEECVSASSDGSCIIWDLSTFRRRSSLFANTLFKAVLYHPDESQLVTAGLLCMLCLTVQLV